MGKTLSFPYSTASKAGGDAALRPLLPLTLQLQSNTQEASGLLDTGADVNVLPYSLGLALGAAWDEQQTAVMLSGNLATFEARGLLLSAKVGDFEPVKLAFAWTRAESVPLILGQVNFFMAFDVCFYRSQRMFQVSLSE